MKKTILFALAIMVCFAASAKQARTEMFDKIKINVPAHVKVKMGPMFGISVKSDNEQKAEAVNWTVKDGVLTVNATAVEDYDADGNDLEITIVSPFFTDVVASNEMDKQETNTMPRFMHRHFFAMRK